MFFVIRNYHKLHEKSHVFKTVYQTDYGLVICC